MMLQDGKDSSNAMRDHRARFDHSGLLIILAEIKWQSCSAEIPSILAKREGEKGNALLVLSIKAT
jgi:hypothetical protein